jgi:hypothetical protein
MNQLIIYLISRFQFRIALQKTGLIWSTDYSIVKLAIMLFILIYLYLVHLAMSGIRTSNVSDDRH